MRRSVTGIIIKNPEGQNNTKNSALNSSSKPPKAGGIYDNFAFQGIIFLEFFSSDFTTQIFIFRMCPNEATYTFRHFILSLFPEYQMQIKYFLPVLAFISFFACLSANAKDTGRSLIESDSLKKRIEKRIYQIKPLEGNAPVIDGKTDDACWQNNNWQGNFTQREPRDGAPPSQETTFNILYDETNIYVAMRCYDNEPNKIDRQTSRRDNFAGDIAGVAFDSYFDHRTAFEFDLTAAGAKIDAMPLNGGTSWDMDWDPVWTGKTALEDSAWTLEMSIPLSQVRFGQKDVHTWGLHVWRYINRLNEESDWQYIPMDSPGMVHLYGELHGLKGIKNSRRIELLPYTLGNLHTFRKVEGNPFAKGMSNNFSFGLDGKIGITSELTMDFTINPDFGQVEADPAVMNLSAYEVFYSEKRPFFIEGKNILNFPVNDDLLFYSRRIGQQPHFTPQLRSGEYMDMPDKTSILSAIKFSGKTKDGWSIGILHSLTNKEEASVSSPIGDYKKTVEPLTNYFAGRFQKEYNDGATIFGGMMTAVHRSLNSEDLKFLNRDAINGGFDIRHRWNEKTYYFEAKGIFSHVAGDRKAILLTQTSPVHYFQREDKFRLDTTLTSLSGHGGSFAVGKEGGGNWRFMADFRWRSDGLELNDLGYLRQADLLRQSSMLGYVVNKPVSFIRNYSAYLNESGDWDYSGKYLQSNLALRLNVQMLNNYGINYRLTRNSEALDTRLLRGGPAFRLPSWWENACTIYSNRADKFVLELYTRLRKSQDGVSKVYEYSPYLLWRLSTAFNLSASFSYVGNKDAYQYVNGTYPTGTKAFMLGEINQKTLSMVLRLDYYITPELSIQYYANSFTSSGSYSSFKAVQDDQRRVYSGGYKALPNDLLIYDSEHKVYFARNDKGITEYIIFKPDFTSRQFRSNLVLRWEYSAGSSFYLVWSQGRSSYMRDNNFSFSDILQGHSDIYPDNIFLVKINHWFSL